MPGQVSARQREHTTAWAESEGQAGGHSGKHAHTQAGRGWVSRAGVGSGRLLEQAWAGTHRTLSLGRPPSSHSSGMVPSSRPWPISSLRSLRAAATARQQSQACRADAGITGGRRPARGGTGAAPAPRWPLLHAPDAAGHTEQPGTHMTSNFWNAAHEAGSAPLRTGWLVHPAGYLSSRVRLMLRGHHKGGCAAISPPSEKGG